MSLAFLSFCGLIISQKWSQGIFVVVTPAGFRANKIQSQCHFDDLFRMSSHSTIFSDNFSSLKLSFSHIFPMKKTTQDGTLYVADCGNRRVVRVGPEVEVFGEAPEGLEGSNQGSNHGIHHGISYKFRIFYFFFPISRVCNLRNMGVFWILRVFPCNLQGWPNPIDVVFAETAAGESGRPGGPLYGLIEVSP